MEPIIQDSINISESLFNNHNQQFYCLNQQRTECTLSQTSSGHSLPLSNSFMNYENDYKQEQQNMFNSKEQIIATEYLYNFNDHNSNEHVLPSFITFLE
jgi:hypothetical protein